MNRHDFLCKYFAGDATYYDSETGLMISSHSNYIDWENKRYYDHNNWKPCYQEKDVTGVSIISNLVRYFVVSILGAYILYNIIKTIYLVLTHQAISDFWVGTTFSVFCVGLVVLLLKIWDILENWRIETCVLGKSEEDDKK